MHTREELAYLAGFIDGEGCFFIGLFNTKSKSTGNITPNYHTLLKISNNNYEVLEWIRDRFGGSIDKRNKKQKLRQFETLTYSLEFTGNSLTDITQELLPFLIVKKKHAEVMLRMRATFKRYVGGHPAPLQETKDLRYALMRELRTLNTRFHDHPLKN